MKPTWRFDPVDWVLHVHIPGPAQCGCEYLYVRLPCIYGIQPDYKLIHRDDSARVLATVRNLAVDLPTLVSAHTQQCGGTNEPASDL